MPWGVLAAGIGAAGSIGGSLLSSGAQSSAASAASQEQMQMFDVLKKRLKPWVTGGQNSLQVLLQSLGVGPNGSGGINASKFQGSPGYQWQLGQGEQAIRDQAAATGGVNSGNTLKALQTYGTGLANQDWYNYLNQLSGVSNTGEAAAAGVGAGALSTGAGIASNTIGAGNATAAGIAGATNGGTNLLQLASLFGGMGGGSGASNPFTPNSSMMFGTTGFGGGGIYPA